MKLITIRTRAILVGILILVAYGVLVSSVTQVKSIVMVADIISGIAVIGIAVLMFPLFRNLNKSLSFSYLLLKIVEGVLMISGGLLFLNPSTQYIRDIIYGSIHLYIFIIGGFVFYFLLLKSRLVPRFIIVWGTAGISALLVSTLLSLFGLKYAILDYLLILIITNEIFLAIWLMIKGFSESAIKKQ